MAIRILLLSFTLLVLSSCGMFKSKKQKCHKPQEYQKADIGPRVQIPTDLKPLDANLRLDVPDGERMTEPMPKGEPCLTDPPRYTDRD
jgi:uncharacterized lipoprotein